MDRFVQRDEYPIMKFYISWHIITGNHCNWVGKSGILNCYTICLNINSNNSKVMFICVLNNPYKMNYGIIEQTVCPKNHDTLLNFFITKIYLPSKKFNKYKVKEHIPKFYFGLSQLGMSALQTYNQNLISSPHLQKKFSVNRFIGSSDFFFKHFEPLISWKFLIHKVKLTNNIA